MHQRFVRAGAAAAVLSAAALALSGCASWQISQHAWAGKIQRLPGVESLNLSYANPWPSGGVQHNAELVLSPAVSEAEAREIAAASCESNPKITAISVTNGDRALGERLVERYDIATQACINADELARFANAVAAMTALGPGFVGNFEQAGWYELDPSTTVRYWNHPAASYTVSIPVTDDAMLIDALRELTSRITDVPLSVGGSEAPDGHLWQTDGPPVDVWLTTDADFDRIAPALTAALALPYTAILATDDTITVRLAADADFDSAGAAAFRAAAAAAGVEANVSPILLRSGDPAAEQDFLDELRGVPGGVALSSDRQTDLVVQTSSPEGTRAAAELLFASGGFKAGFELSYPGPDGFAISFYPARPSVGSLAAFPEAAYAALEEARAVLPEGGTLRLQVEGDELSLSAGYSRDTSNATMEEVSAILEEIAGADGDLFTTVTVTPSPKRPAAN